MSLLKVDELDVFYGDFHAVRGVSLKVDEAQTVAIIGANGAGKSTLLQAITGLNMQKRGAVTFDGKDIGWMRADLIARNGVTMVPEGRRLFGSLVVDAGKAKRVLGWAPPFSLDEGLRRTVEARSHM